MLDKLDVKQMRIFLNLMREKSVSKAALRMNISQQAMSAHLKRLRELFPHELFLRKSDGLEPTDFACDLAAKLDATVSGLDELVASTPFDPSAADQVVRILADEYSLLTILPRLCRDVAAAAPNLSLDIQDFNVIAHADVLAQGNADVVIAFADLIDPSLVKKTIKTDGFSCVVSKRSTIPRRVSCWEDLTDVQQVGFSRSIDKPDPSGARAFGRVSPPKKPVAVLPCYTSLHAFMEFNDVFAYVPSAIARTHDLQVLPLALTPNDVEIAVAWHRRTAGSSLRQWLVERIARSAALEQ